MKSSNKSFLVALSILVGTCIGAGVLGLPYIAAQSGFFITVAYIIVIGVLVFGVNLYLGEVSLRTKKKHQIGGYARKYLGQKGMVLTEFAFIFGIYSAVIAYMFGVGDSLSFLVFGNLNYSIFFGIFFGIFMSFLIWRGMKSLKRFEEWGVSLVLFLLILIVLVFIKQVDFNNLYTINLKNLFLPFGVVLFSLLSFHAVPEVKIVLAKNKKLMKKAIFFGTLIPVIFYILFVFVVVGFKGINTPEIATLSLGPVFVIVGILTMFTSYLALGYALEENLRYDKMMSKNKSWFYASIIPIFLFLFVRFFNYFSFTKILSIGGVISGGLLGILILLINKSAKKKGDRNPEYSIPINWFIIVVVSLIFILGVLTQVLPFLFR